jgi:hypothetical protein
MPSRARSRHRVPITRSPFFRSSRAICSPELPAPPTKDRAVRKLGRVPVVHRVQLYDVGGEGGGHLRDGRGLERAGRDDELPGGQRAGRGLDEERVVGLAEPGDAGV